MSSPPRQISLPSHSLTHKHPHPPARTHTYTRARAHTHTHTHTHTHIQNYRIFKKAHGGGGHSLTHEHPHTSAHAPTRTRMRAHTQIQNYRTFEEAHVATYKNNQSIVLPPKNVFFRPVNVYIYYMCIRMSNRVLWRVNRALLRTCITHILNNQRIVRLPKHRSFAHRERTYLTMYMYVT